VHQLVNKDFDTIFVFTGDKQVTRHKLYTTIRTGFTTRNNFTTIMVILASAYQIYTRTFEMLRVETENGRKAFLQKLRHVYLSYDTTACVRCQ